MLNCLVENMYTGPIHTLSTTDQFIPVPPPGLIFVSSPAVFVLSSLPNSVSMIISFSLLRLGYPTAPRSNSHLNCLVYNCRPPFCAYPVTLVLSLSRKTVYDNCCHPPSTLIVCVSFSTLPGNCHYDCGVPFPRTPHDCYPFA